jgi:hypothetical protein
MLVSCVEDDGCGAICLRRRLPQHMQALGSLCWAAYCGPSEAAQMLK